MQPSIPWSSSVSVFVIERMIIIHSLKCTVPFSFVVSLLSLDVTHCHLLSLVITCCVTYCQSLSLVVTCCTTRCHSLSLVVTCCHSLSLVAPLVVTRFTTRCHSLSFFVTRCPTRCHSFSFVVICCTTRLSFYKWSFLSVWFDFQFNFYIFSNAFSNLSVVLCKKLNNNWKFKLCHFVVETC